MCVKANHEMISKCITDMLFFICFINVLSRQTKQCCEGFKDDVESMLYFSFKLPKQENNPEAFVLIL